MEKVSKFLVKQVSELSKSLGALELVLIISVSI